MDGCVTIPLELSHILPLFLVLLRSGQKEGSGWQEKRFFFLVCISLVVVHALSLGGHPDIGSSVGVSMDSPKAPMDTSLMNRPLIWMHPLAGPDDTFQKLLPVAEIPIASYHLLVLCQQGILFGRSPTRQFKHGYLAPRTYILILPNHGRAVSPNSNSPLLNVQTKPDPASLSPSDFPSDYYLCSFVPANSWGYLADSSNISPHSFTLAPQRLGTGL